MKTKSKSFSFKLPKEETLPVLLSIATIVLAILTIVVFIAYGGGISFYIVFLIAAVVAIYNILTISKLKR